MSVVGDVNVRVGLDPSGIARGLRRAEADLKRAGERLNAIGNQLSMTLSAPLAAMGISALKSAGELESLKLGFNTTMAAAGRSAAEAKKELEELLEVSKMPGIDFEAAIKGSQRLQGVGMSAEKAREIIEQLANGISMAGGTAQNLSGITNQLAQMAGKGKVMQEDLNIMLENMPMLAKVMKDTFGATTADGLRDMGINAEKFIDGITEGLSKLERVPGGLQNSFVNTGVSIKLALSNIGEALNKSFNITGKLEAFSAWIMDTANAFSNLSDNTKNTIFSAVALVAAIGPAVKVFAVMHTALGKLRIAYMSLTAAKAVYRAAMLQSYSDTVTGAANVTNFESKLKSFKKAWDSLNFSTKAMAIGAVGIAIAGAALAFNHFSNSLSTASRKQQAMIEITGNAEKSIVQQTNEAKKQVAVLTDGNAKLDDRKAALAKLNEIAPEYFGKLSVEKSSVDAINQSYSAYVKNLRQVALAKSADDKLKSLTDEQLDLKMEVQRFVRSTSNAERAMIAIKNSFSMGNMLGDNDFIAGANRRLAELGEEIKSVEGYSYKLSQTLKETNSAVPLTNNFGGSGTGEKSQKRKLVTAPDLLPSVQDVEESWGIIAAHVGSQIEKAVPQVKASVERFKHPLTALGEEFEIIDNKAAVMGDGFNPITEKINALKAAMATLLSQGANPFGVAITSMKEQLAGLDNSLELNRQKWVEFGQTVTEQVNQAIAESLATLATGIGEVLAGASNFKAVMNAALSGVLDMLIYVGKLAIQTGIAVLGIKKALETLNPFVAIAGGVALIALASFAKTKLAKSTERFAEGGIVSGPTNALIGEYAGARSNPEVVAPLDKLQGILERTGGARSNGQVQVYGTIKASGRDLLVVIEQAQMDKFRRSGA